MAVLEIIPMEWISAAFSLPPLLGSAWGFFHVLESSHQHHPDVLLKGTWNQWSWVSLTSWGEGSSLPLHDCPASPELLVTSSSAHILPLHGEWLPAVPLTNKAVPPLSLGVP